MKKIIYLTTLFSLLFALISCEPERALYSETRGAEVSFPATGQRINMVAEDNGKFEVELWRGNSDGALTVPVVITGDLTPFTPAAEEFVFAPDQNSATLVFSYDDLSNFGGEIYSITIAVADENLIAISGIDEVKLTVRRQLTFKLYQTGVFYSDIYGEGWEQELYKAEEGDLYRFPSLYYNGYDIEFEIVGSDIIIPSYQATGEFHGTYGAGMWHNEGGSNYNAGVYEFNVSLVVDVGGGLARWVSYVTELFVVDGTPI